MRAPEATEVENETFCERPPSSPLSVEYDHVLALWRVDTQLPQHRRHLAPVIAGVVDQVQEPRPESTDVLFRRVLHKSALVALLIPPGAAD